MKGNRNSNNSGNRDGVMVAAGKNIVKRTPTPYNNRIQRINLQWNCKAMETRTFSMETKLWCENMRPAVTNHITTTLSKQTQKKLHWITEMKWNKKRINKNRCNGSKLSNNWAHSSAHYAKNCTRFPMCADKNKHFETFIGWILGQAEITCEIREHTTTPLKCIRFPLKNWNSEISTEMRLLRKQWGIFTFVNTTVR